MLTSRAINPPVPSTRATRATRATVTVTAAIAALALPSAHAAAQQVDRPVTLPPAEQALVDDGQDVVHVVQPGEHLSAIASAYGVEGEDGWRRLFDANPGIDDPNLLEPGDEVRIPHPDEEFDARELPDAGLTATAAPEAGAATTTAGVWDRLAQCESGGNWAIDTGNGYYGGLQFSLSSWQAVGGTGYPHEHSRATQIALGERLLARQGWGAWPACSAKLGLR